MLQLENSLQLLLRLVGKTALITGSARGIGAATAVLFNAYGSNVVMTDLPSLREEAETIIRSMKYPEKAVFVPASVTEWKLMVDVFKAGKRKFGQIDVVVANAGIMESKPVLEVEVDENGDPIESREAERVIDVNLIGAFNTLRLAIHYMRSNSISEDRSRGSIVLVASTSGYFGSTGNVAYIASKHGVIGLLRASQQYAESLGIRINAVAPSFTPTFITSGFSDQFQKSDVESNTPEMVATAIANAAIDPNRRSSCCLVAGRFLRELESTQKDMMPEWLGSDLLNMMGKLATALKDIGGYKLPKQAVTA